jgi:DNA-binding NarL/FixJ family response regulator
MIRIMLIDDHALVREALGRLLEDAHDLRAVSPRTRLLMLSMHARADYVQQALRAGADGYVLKECAGQEVVASARELEVLKLVVEGNTSHEVATMLGLSPKSIDTYRSRLMTKLNIDHLPALVKFAIRRGLTNS